MPATEAQIRANQQNALKSSGPKTAEGKQRSRANAVKHGLTGKGIVGLAETREEVGRRVEALEADLKPSTTAGVFLIAQMATLSIRVERAAEHEAATTAMRVRHAADDFDEARIAQAHQLLESIHEDPRENLRKLKKSPEGVERLRDAWLDLRADLTNDPRPIWNASHLELAGHLTGVRTEHARSTRIGVLSRAFWTDFTALKDGDGAGLDDQALQQWAKAQLLERIDAEVAGLEAHYETLDFETIAIDRAEAGSRCLFDTSREAILARRYETESRNGFFKALKEFRKVEAEAEARVESIPSPTPEPEPEPELGSFREPTPPTDREPSTAFADHGSLANPVVLNRDGQPLELIPVGISPG